MTLGDKEILELHELINGAIDGWLSPTECDRLRQFLRDSAEARRYYLRTMHLSAALRSIAEQSSAEPGNTVSPSALPPSVLRRLWSSSSSIGGLVAIVAVVLLVAVGIGISVWHGRTVQPKESTLAAIAVLSQTVDVQWASRAEARGQGSPILPGWLKIRSGLAQVTFHDGATVIVEGPAELQLISADAAFCSSGRLSAEVPPPARGFQVSTPQLTVKDLGTAFGLDVTTQGSEVDVFKGQVELSQQADDRQTLHEGEGLVVDTAGKPRRIVADQSRFALAEDLHRRKAEHAADGNVRAGDGKQGFGEAIDLKRPTIVFRKGSRQTISGWGAGAGEDNGPGQNFGSLSEARKARLAALLYSDAHIDTLRVWASLESISRKAGEVDVSRFVNGYVKSGFIKYARDTGMKRLLLAPGGIPQYMLAKDPSPAAAGQRPLTDDGIKQYAALIAGILHELKLKHNVDFHMTGIANECCAITIPQWPRVIRELRKDLDAYGLRSVKITAVEWPNNDGWAFDRIRSIQNDPAAWPSLDAISTHSYAMPATEDFYRQFCLKQPREFWITETECSGPKPVDCGKDLAGHMINDLNHGVTCWMYHEIALNCSPDNPANLVGYDFKASDASWLIVPPKYHYYKQLSSALPAGTVLRQASSNETQDMRYPGSATKYTACGGRTADGSWAMAVVNLTPVNGGTTVTVQLAVEELAAAAQLVMKATHSGNGKNNEPAADVVFRHGVTTVTLEPDELLTLRSSPIPPTAP